MVTPNDSIPGCLFLIALRSVPNVWVETSGSLNSIGKFPLHADGLPFQLEVVTPNFNPYHNVLQKVIAVIPVAQLMLQAPGGALSIKADRVVQTTISRLASGHIRGLSFNLGQKIYENCTKCNLVQATPDHLLFCAGLEREDIYSSPLLVYDFLRTLGLMDLV
ncbi:uncharacterized protein TNCV_2331141 [Trichonephila clavipes]|nr:uncharacterized protein TNCV_2331141 [Trichonephila clavipes]